MNKAIIYVHGKGGSVDEASYYKKFFPNHDIFGVDYSDYFPWVASQEIKEEYQVICKQYDETLLITNSIGTMFAMLGLQDCSIKKAFCISPILDMEQLIINMMTWAGVSETQLQEKKEIETDFGETLSWDYLSYIRAHPIRWTVPTSILYAGNDKLTTRATVDAFVATHPSILTVMEDGEHWFHTKEQLAFLDAWMKREAALV